MKKIIALFLVAMMLLTFAACGNTKTDVNTESNSSTISTENTESTESSNKEMSAEELQSYYENYFKGDDVGFASKSFVTETEGIKVVFSETEKECLFSMTVLKNSIEIYKDENDKQYVHLKFEEMENEEGEKTEGIDAWFNFVPSENDEETDDALESVSSDFNTDDLIIDADEIKEIKYEKTENGIDYVTVTTNNVAEGVEVTIDGEEYDGTVKTTFGIDTKTHKIVYVETIENDIKTTVTFTTTEDIKITIPENTEEINGEQVAMYYMALVFSTLA